MKLNTITLKHLQYVMWNFLDDNLFAEEPLPEEMEDDWNASAVPRALALELVPPVLSTAFGNQVAYGGDLDTAIVDLLAVSL